MALHSNAGGGQGTEGWIYGTGGKGERLANCIYKYVAPLSPGADREIKLNPSFAELGATNAPAVIMELGFHDYGPDADWIRTQPKQIAEAIAKGICEYAGISFVPEPSPVSQPVPPPLDAEKEALKTESATLRKTISELNALVNSPQTKVINAKNALY